MCQGHGCVGVSSRAHVVVGLGQTITPDALVHHGYHLAIRKRSTSRMVQTYMSGEQTTICDLIRSMCSPLIRNIVSPYILSRPALCRSRLMTATAFSSNHGAVQHAATLVTRTPPRQRELAFSGNCSPSRSEGCRINYSCGSRKLTSCHSLRTVLGIPVAIGT